MFRMLSDAGLLSGVCGCSQRDTSFKVFSEQSVTIHMCHQYAGDTKHKSGYCIIVNFWVNMSLLH